MLPAYSNAKGFKSSTVKDMVFRWFRLIWSDRNTRNLLCFLCLNFLFGFVELIYGFWTNSLGLISDSFHMFFDCYALVAGLVASLVTKWACNDRYSFGYMRAEIMAGFVNGLFLLFIAFGILKNALDRLFEPPDVKHEHLLMVSILGFFVNLVGIFVFNHGGHGHSHGGDDHSHSHSHGHDMFASSSTNPLLSDLHNSPYGSSPSFVSVSTPPVSSHSHNGHGHSHSGSSSHGHSHGGGGGSGSGGKNQIMQGVFLHILADTLGSVGVIISAILMSQFGWMIADPICSLMIATLIAISVVPLIKSSLEILMQRTPHSLEVSLPMLYQRITSLQGVVSVQDPHFWTLCTDKYVGQLRVEVTRTADYNFVQNTIRSILVQAGVEQVYIEIHYSHN